MKRVLLFTLVLLSFIWTANAQGQEKDWSESIHIFSFHGDWVLNGHSDTDLASLQYEYGYAFNKRWSVLVPLTATYASWKAEQHNRLVKPSATLGLGAGFNAIHTDKDRLELTVRCSNTMFGPDDWDYMAYDFGLRYGKGLKRGGYSSFLGIGVKYYDHLKGPMNNYFTFYLSIGCRFH